MKFLEDYLPEFYSWLNLNITSVFAVGLVCSDFVYKRTGTDISIRTMGSSFAPHMQLIQYFD